MGLMTEYEVWEFLRTKPSEVSVIETLGLPDSVWLSPILADQHGNVIGCNSSSFQVGK